MCRTRAAASAAGIPEEVTNKGRTEEPRRTGTAWVAVRNLDLATPMTGMPNSAFACAPGVALGTLHIADTETAVSATPEEVRDAFAAVAAERFALAERPGRAGRRGPDRCSHRPQAGPPPRSGHPGPRAAAAARAGRTRPAGRAQAAPAGYEA